MRVLSKEEMVEVAGGTWGWSWWSWSKPKSSYTPPKCDPKPVCEPKPVCDPKPSCNPKPPCDDGAEQVP